MDGVGPFVLVVEDDLSIRTLICEALADEGFAVQGSGDAASAVAAARQQRPAAVILDIGLPGADGFAVARDIRRAHPEAPPIIVVSAGHRAERSAEILGAVSYLAKPFDVAELIRMVRQATGSPDPVSDARGLTAEQA